MNDLEREYDRRAGVMRLRAAGVAPEEWPLSLSAAALDTRTEAFAVKAARPVPALLERARAVAERDPDIAAVLRRLVNRMAAGGLIDAPEATALDRALTP